MNGYEVARKIKSYLDPGVVLIAVTGWGQHETRGSCDSSRASRSAGIERTTRLVVFL
jgi:DNA-binding LytR/AlgR family response regulator